MNIQDLQGKLVAVLGFGMEGRAVAEYLIKHGIRPTLFDCKRWEEWNEEDKTYIRNLGVNFIFDPDWVKEFKGFDAAFRSPGIKLSDLKADKPANYKTILTSQTKWFFEHCPCKIIGVTGTKGKGTTASLIYEILKKNFQFPPLRQGFVGQAISNFQNGPRSEILNPKSKIFLTGNIGKQQPLEFLDDLKADDWVVYELSSFQLQDLKQSPHIGVVLMATQEHLDYHNDVKEYCKAKTPIVKYQTKDDFAVINSDFVSSMEIGKQGDGQKYYFSRKKNIERGCFVVNDQLIVKDIFGQNFQFPITNIQLRGRHNLENVCAATAASILSGVKVNAVKETLNNFKGLEHRLEFVSEKNGIKFYNDSFSTTPETAIAAVKSFSEPMVLILGGSSKNSDFKDLGRTIIESNNIKAIILIGQEAGKIKQAIGQAGEFKGKLLEGAKTMPEIFNQINLTAATGDVVLLSPACASFDMFDNYKDRGEQFKNYANIF